MSQLLIPVLVLGLWVLLQMDSGFGSDQCADGYAAATTAADSARVDSLVPGDGHGGKEKFSCGFRRMSAGGPGWETRSERGVWTAGTIL